MSQEVEEIMSKMSSKLSNSLEHLQQHTEDQFVKNKTEECYKNNKNDPNGFS